MADTKNAERDDAEDSYKNDDEEEEKGRRRSMVIIMLNRKLTVEVHY